MSLFSYGRLSILLNSRMSTFYGSGAHMLENSIYIHGTSCDARESLITKCNTVITNTRTNVLANGTVLSDSCNTDYCNYMPLEAACIYNFFIVQEAGGRSGLDMPPELYLIM